MTRILRLLLIAAVAWPLCHPAAAQEMANGTAMSSKIPSRKTHVASTKVNQIAHDSSVKRLVSKSSSDRSKMQSAKVPLKSKGSIRPKDIVPPSGLTAESWSLTTTWYLYGENGFEQKTFNKSSVQVIIDGDEIFINGLCYWLDNSWVRGTINGNVATFKAGQLMGVDDDGYENWFFGFDNVNSALVDVVFTFDRGSKTLTLDSNTYIWCAYYSDEETVQCTDLHLGTVIKGTTTTSNYLPVYTNYYGYKTQHSQTIYPESMLAAYKGTKLTSITYYPSDGIKFYNGSVKVSLGPTNLAQFPSSSPSFVTGLTQVASIVPSRDANAREWTIVFDTPYEYNGGNLVVDIQTTQGTTNTTTANTTHFNCESVSGTYPSYHSYYSRTNAQSATTSRRALRPVVTFGYEVTYAERPITILSANDLDEISYEWPINATSGQQSSKLTEIATDPDQMIAMIRKVYMTPSVPGNLYRGFDKRGKIDPSNPNVPYAGVGEIYCDGEDLTDANNYKYRDSHGWDIIGNLGGMNYLTLEANNEYPGETDPVFYAYMNQNEYRPVEGLTLLLLELKDTYTHQDFFDVYNGSYDNEYLRLKDFFTKYIKSVRIVSENKRYGTGLDAGTLFKIDCEKMNKFFLLAKGRLQANHNSYNFFNEVSWIKKNQQMDFFVPPFFMYWNGENWYQESNNGPLFHNMFEQFSPSMPSDSHATIDLYQKMVTEMESFPVIHDCVGIANKHHEFMLYGEDSEDHDCQDIHDLMFFVPDYRMLYHEGRGSLTQEYLNYNPKAQPTMGMFVIKQYPITGEQISGQETYKLHLTWDSNLLKFLPGEEGQYTLYRVITNADGTKTYQAVGEFDPNTFEYYDNVPMQKNGQQVTYVVQGQDVGKFLSLQMSNEESYIIPGLDREEQLRIALNNDYYFSRYDAATQTNNYSNSVIANNTVGTNVKPSYLQNAVAGSDVGKFKFWRATVNEVNGEMVVDTENAVNFVTAWVSNYNSATGGTLTYRDWTDQTDFSSKYYGHGYHQNPTSSTFSIVDDEVVFDGLKLYDNFSVSVEANTHPAQYVYYVTLETAVPFALNEAGTETSTQARSNTVSVPVYKTEMAMNPISAQDVEDDVTHQFPAATKFDVNARYSSRSEILGYYIYRWADGKTAAVDRSIYEDDGADASPQGQAGNQGEYYTVAMNTDFTGRTENFGANYADVTASFEDNYVNKAQAADTYTYAPVVELFAPIQAVELPSGADRVDYNTYGGSQQMSAGGLVDVEVVKYAPSSYSWNAGGKEYRYYNVNLKVNPNKEIVPEGYEIAKVRAWRKIASKYLGEQAATQNTPDYTGRLNLDVNGEYMFVNKEDCQKGEELGAELLGTSGNNGPVYSGTFGAVALEQGDEIPMSFVVRVYFTKSQPAGAPMLKAEGDQRYYIAETVVEDKLTYEIPTGIDGVGVMNNVASVKYYNAAGVESDIPFQGVNIVVTRYNDGSTTTTKILK